MTLWFNSSIKDDDISIQAEFEQIDTYLRTQKLVHRDCNFELLDLLKSVQSTALTFSLAVMKKEKIVIK
ncbi:hypothetical protein [Candidatus Parabeggiatoa sp. HSG14]|uniref:hypothetical protein n=1 Tax=Candidatus Parabeggiatoa sp. HSG14 TaxID=3055593 RepID=UPI0025A77DA8|nr:hypothetical protein [Thiotrichales bacterium HSG14]